MPQEEKKTIASIVVIGGGFGGMHVVEGLRKTAINITLLDRNNYHLFQPLLYQVATSELEPAGIASPIRQILKSQDNVTIALAEVQDIDFKRQVVIGKRVEIAYDYLVIATGVQTTYFGHDKYKPFAPGLKSIDDALEIRRRILVAYEEAEWEANEASRQAKLTFVIVGGGPTGVELAGAISDAARRTLPKDFKQIDTTTTRVILINSSDRLVKMMPVKLSQRVRRDLEKMGVEIRLNTRVTDVDEDGVLLSDERIPADNVFWAAGVEGVPLTQRLEVKRDPAGRIIVESDMSIPGHANAFVIGDAAHAIDAKTGNPVPGVAQGAIQTGKFVAEIIKNELNTTPQPERPIFSYFDKGSMATIGRGNAVTAVGDYFFGGFIGFLAWNALHAAFLVGFRRKFMVVFTWIWNYILNERAARIITGQPETHITQIIETANIKNTDTQKIKEA